MCKIKFSEREKQEEASFTTQVLPYEEHSLACLLLFLSKTERVRQEEIRIRREKEQFRRNSKGRTLSCKDSSLKFNWNSIEKISEYAEEADEARMSDEKVHAYYIE